MSTFGIEEEFFLLHPETGLPADPDAATSAIIMGIKAGGIPLRPNSWPAR